MVQNLIFLKKFLAWKREIHLKIIKKIFLAYSKLFPFKINFNKSSNPVACIYTDVWVSFSSLPASSHKYFIPFIDHCNRINNYNIMLFFKFTKWLSYNFILKFKCFILTMIMSLWISILMTYSKLMTFFSLVNVWLQTIKKCKN